MEKSKEIEGMKNYAGLLTEIAAWNTISYVETRHKYFELRMPRPMFYGPEIYVGMGDVLRKKC